MGWGVFGICGLLSNWLQDLGANEQWALRVWGSYGGVGSPEIGDAGPGRGNQPPTQTKNFSSLNIPGRAFDQVTTFELASVKMLTVSQSGVKGLTV